MSYSQRLNNFLARNFQVSINRIEKPQPLPPRIKGGGNNLIIEFIGASCIGKTYLYDYYIEHHQFSFPKKLLTKKDLAPYLQKEFKLFGLQDQLLKNLFKTLTDNTKISGYKKYKMIKRSINSLQRDYLINHHFTNETFIFAEHLFSIPTINDILVDQKTTKKVFENRIFIYCTAPFKTYLQYIKSRQEQNTAHYFYKNVKLEEVKQEAERRLGAKENIVSNLKSKGATFLTVNTGDSLEENVKLIDGYISNYL